MKNILQKNKMRRVKQHTKQKNNNDKNKINIIMDGFNFHYRIGCLITSIWMDGYCILLWDTKNQGWSGGIIFKNIVIILLHIICPPFPTNYRNNWKPRIEGYFIRQKKRDAELFR